MSLPGPEEYTHAVSSRSCRLLALHQLHRSLKVSPLYPFLTTLAPARSCTGDPNAETPSHTRIYTWAEGSYNAVKDGRDRCFLYLLLSIGACLRDRELEFQNAGDGSSEREIYPYPF